MNIQEEFDRVNRQIIADGYIPKTVAFTIQKFYGICKVAKEYNALPVFNPDNAEAFEIVALYIYKSFGRHSLKVAQILKLIYKLKKFFRPIEVYKMDGHKLYFNWFDSKSRYIFEDYKLKDIWEPETTKIVKQHVKPGDTCLDIGASIGYFTLLMSSLTGPKGKVYAFEPMTRGYKYLCKNIKVNGYEDRAKAFQLAAWDKTEIIGMPRCDDNPIPSQCVSVSEHLEKLGVTKVDFIKIDIDGSEPWAFRGLVPLFEKNPQMKMVCEYYPKYIKDAGGDPNDMMDIVNKYFTTEVIEGDYGEGYWNYFCKHK